MSAMPPQRGELRWAAVPYVFASPVLGPDWDGPRDLAGVIAEVRGRRGAVRAELPFKVRPVLVLHSWVGAAHGAYVVLRTKRLESLTAGVRALAERGDDPALVPLHAPSAGARRAVLLTGIARIDQRAIDGEPLGRASTDEMRRIGEGLAALLELDLDRLVERRARDLVGGLA
jgi:hypothetical protein